MGTGRRSSLSGIAAKFVSDDISQPPQGISNISEWCKKEACWQQIIAKLPSFVKTIPHDFWDDSISVEELDLETRTAKKTQKIDDGIVAQKIVCELPTSKWGLILKEGQARRILTPKEIGILNIARQIPSKIPSEKQSIILVAVLEKVKGEGISVDG